MTPNLVVRRAALDEIELAAAWYERRRVGLGVEFIAEIDRVFAAIVAAPQRPPIWKKGFPYRRGRATRFPYSVFFEMDGSAVVVMAIGHAKRRPGYWLARSAR